MRIVYEALGGCDMVQIRTNHQWRALVSRTDVPADVLADQFDWTNEAYEKHGDYSDGFFRYRGVWYHLGDFIRGDVGGTSPEWNRNFWDGSHGDSYFSGVLIKLSDDGEYCKVATYYS